MQLMHRISNLAEDGSKVYVYPTTYQATDIDCYYGIIIDVDERLRWFELEDDDGTSTLLRLGAITNIVIEG